MGAIHKTASKITGTKKIHSDNISDIMVIIKNIKWTWAGHINRRTDNRWIPALTLWIQMGDKINQGRQ